MIVMPTLYGQTYCNVSYEKTKTVPLFCEEKKRNCKFIRLSKTGCSAWSLQSVHFNEDRVSTNAALKPVNTALPYSARRNVVRPSLLLGQHVVSSQANSNFKVGGDGPSSSTTPSDPGFAEN